MNLVNAKESKQTLDFIIITRSTGVAYDDLYRFLDHGLKVMVIDICGLLHFMMFGLSLKSEDSIT